MTLSVAFHATHGLADSAARRPRPRAISSTSSTTSTPSSSPTFFTESDLMRSVLGKPPRPGGRYSYDDFDRSGAAIHGSSIDAVAVLPLVLMLGTELFTPQAEAAARRLEREEEAARLGEKALSLFEPL